MRFLYCTLFCLFGVITSLPAGSPVIAVPINMIDNFDDGNVSDWVFFGGNNAGGGGGTLDDRPKEGSFYFSTGWGGMGTSSGFYGGSFKNLDNNNQIALPVNPYLCFWVLNQSNATVDEFILEIIIREDLDGNGWTDGSEDSFIFDTSFQSSSFNDDWVLISVPLCSFNDLFTGGDGTFDGDLDEIVIGITGVVGGDGSTVEIDFDEFAFCSGNPCPESVQFASDQYEVPEGDTAQISIKLNNISDYPVTIMYATAESSAIPDRDFVPASGMLTIPAGSLSATFPVITIDNTKPDGDRSVMINLFDANGAEIGFIQKTRLTILDDDPEDPMLIDDFEMGHPFQSAGNIAISTKELANGSRNALLCQGAYEYVASASGDGTLLRTFVESQDWTAATGLSFWFYGKGSGEEIKVGIKDNRSITTANTDPNTWVLAWSDEFNTPDGTPPNPNIWKNDIGDGSLNGNLGWGNAERQFYTDDPVNAATDGNGNMVITMQEFDPETTDLICWYGPCEYTSARLNTKDKIAFEYGRIETSIKVPAGEDGLWPAFWSLGNNIDEVNWPQAGEIDIMEYVSREPNEIFGTVHGPGYSGGASFGDLYDFGVPVANGYHTFAIEWTPDEIIWFVDGNLYHQAMPADVPGPWVFNHPFFLLLNMAIGGNFGDAISESLTFPQEMLIDYVRVYQAPETAECFEASFTDNKKGWQLVYLPFNEFTRSGDQPNGALNDELGLNEVWGYSITQPDIGELLFDQVRLSEGVPELPCPAIPTISEWGLILLMLLFLIMGIVVVRRKNLKIA